MRCAQRSQPPAAAAVHPDRAYASVSALPALELRALVKDSVRAECKGNFLPPIALDRCSTGKTAKGTHVAVATWVHGVFFCFQLFVGAGTESSGIAWSHVAASVAARVDSLAVHETSSLATKRKNEQQDPANRPWLR
ncbi:hypothetical protein PF008_g11601 [Phytophthora fragariae]|uniref:Uncharacterized protein n=1 Tax=Phytophthora fragariae TaxID=53985 RepID=A0A6G0RQF5_9STRA|nr:hypothetical protein PF008_g11601 [Phytophthora fragariae]